MVDSKKPQTQTLSYWLDLIIGISLENMSENPNWQNKNILKKALSYTKTIIFLNDHLQNYKWLNSHSGKLIKLMDYYAQYDQPKRVRPCAHYCRGLV